MHLILSTRADPPWPLARLRARCDNRTTHRRPAPYATRGFELCKCSDGAGLVRPGYRHPYGAGTIITRAHNWWGIRHPWIRTAEISTSALTARRWTPEWRQACKWTWTVSPVRTKTPTWGRTNISRPACCALSICLSCGTDTAVACSQ
jgi:hypothetical protein